MLMLEAPLELEGPFRGGGNALRIGVRIEVFNFANRRPEKDLGK